MPAKLPSVLVRLAAGEVGVKEQPKGSNCGPRVNQYKAATWLPPEKAWAWCAAFICWLVREAMRECAVPETRTFHRPQTAGAWDLLNWSEAQDLSTLTKRNPKASDVAPGDIMVLRASHVCLAVSECDKDGYLRTIEGNTNDDGSREGYEVARRRRHISEFRGRIRFTV